MARNENLNENLVGNDYIYRLQDLFTIIPEFEGDQILLHTFINSCNAAFQLAEDYQIPLITLHIKNKLKGRASQLINSRQLNTWNEIRDLLLVHFGDSRDLTSLIHDLQKIKQLPNESPLTFAHRVESHNAKLHAAINSQNLTADQKAAQAELIEQMCLNTLLTGLEPKLCAIIRASNPATRGDAIYRIKRELQLSYLETQKFPRHQNLNSIRQNARPNQNFKPVCNYCKKPGHTIDVCYRRQNQNLAPLNTNSFTYNNHPPTGNQNRSFNNFQRPSVIRPNPNFNNQSFQGNSQNVTPRNHHLNSNQSQEIQTGNLAHPDQPSHNSQQIPGNQDFQIESISTQLENLQVTDNIFLH